MKKLFKYNLIILFLLFIFTIPILTGLRHNVEISSIENRTLAPMPELNKASLLSGEFFKGFEEYMSDHIIGRNYFIKSHTALNMKVLQKKNINDIVIGDDNTLLPFFTEGLLKTTNANFENLPTMVERLDKIDQVTRSNGGEFIFVGLPSQSSFFKDRYINYFPFPKDYFTQNEQYFFKGLDEKNVPYINMNKIFMDNYDLNYYLKTDHHFSFKGSFTTYEEIIWSLGLNPLKLEDMILKTIDKPILGSRNRQIYFLQDTDEKITIGYPKQAIEYEKKVNGEISPEMYFVDDNERPSYGVYMGGDHAEIVIETNRPELRNLLIFGDSFTNALEPLLYYHFDETRIIDLRHYNDMEISEYIEFYKPDLVLMVRDDLNYGNLEGNGRIK